MNLAKDWQEKLKECLNAPQFSKLLEKVEAQYKKHSICPPKDKIFNAFNLCPVKDVRVVILGQDPYFNPGQAMGLAFSVNAECMMQKAKPRIQFPPSLTNIIKEIRECFGECSVEDGDLTPWARQGVLLLNTCLTVRQGAPLSHAELGWDFFINAVIEFLNTKDGIVFVLWGNNAKKYKPMLTNAENLVLTAAHPSPLSAHNGFFGCRHFCKINDFLKSRDKKPIVW